MTLVAEIPRTMEQWIALRDKAEEESYVAYERYEQARNLCETERLRSANAFGALQLIRKNIIALEKVSKP